MKNIFKFMGIAVLACGLMVACNKPENNGPSDSTPDTPTPPAPTSSVKVVWDGAEQNLGWTDAYSSTQYEWLYWFEAAQSMNGEEAQFPYFVVPLVYDASAGLVNAAFFNFTTTSGETVAGNDAFPLEVYDSIAIYQEYQGEQYPMGDYQLYPNTLQATSESTFDPTELKLTYGFTATMYNAYWAQESVLVTKDLEVTFTNYKFDAK